MALLVISKQPFLSGGQCSLNFRSIAPSLVESGQQISGELPKLFVEEQICKGCSCSCTIQELHLHLSSGDFTKCKKKYCHMEINKILKAYIKFRKIIKLGRLVRPAHLYLTIK